MSKQNALDYRHGRQGGRIVPWRDPKSDESVAAIVSRAREQAEQAERRGQQLELFPEDDA